MRRPIRRHGGEAGVVATETALVIVPLLIAILGLIGAASLFWIWNTLQLSVDAAARYGMVTFHPGTDPPSWSCRTSTQTNGSAIFQPPQPQAGPLENCVAAAVGQNILAYKGLLFVDLTKGVIVEAHCYQGGDPPTPAAWGGGGAEVPCNQTGPAPDTLAIRAQLDFDLFDFVDIPLVAATAVPLMPVAPPPGA